jgi:hypothetical protein
VLLFGTRALTYAPSVAAAVAAVGHGGGYRLVIDETHEQHAISAHALRLILEDAAAPLCGAEEPGCGEEGPVVGGTTARPLPTGRAG